MFSLMSCFKQDSFSHKYGLVLLLFFCLAFSPLATFFFSMLFMFVTSQRGREGQYVQTVLVSFAVLSLGISSVSLQLFIYEESDLTSYYNAFLQLQKYGLASDVFGRYGFGLEFGLPVLDYLISRVLVYEMPYLYLLTHFCLMAGLVLLIVKRLTSIFGLNLQQSALLLAFMLLFLKFGSLTNHLRQSYSSLFIIFSILEKRWINKFVLISIIFHLSAIVIYPLVRFLLRQQSFGQGFKSSGLLIFLALLIQTFLIPYFDELFYISELVYYKLKFMHETTLDDSSTMAYLRRLISASLYIIVLIFLGFTINRRLFFESCGSLISLLCFLAAFSFLPGLAIRLLQPILMIMIGWLFFKVLYLDLNFRYTRQVGLVMLIFFQAKWLFLNEGYYDRISEGHYIPFYYVADIFEEVGPINRQHLPSLQDIELPIIGTID